MSTPLTICAAPSTTTTTGAVGPVQSAACTAAEVAKRDPATAAQVVMTWDAIGQGAEFAAEVAKHLSDADRKTLARTPAGRDFLDAVEAGLSKGNVDSSQKQLDQIHAARLSACSNAQERAGELIRQAASGHANVDLLGKNLASEIKSDMSTGATLTRAILSNPFQERKFRIASEVAANLSDQELLTLAKTKAGKELLTDMRAALEMPYGMKNAQGTRVDYALDPSKDSYAHHVAQVQSDLYKKGLPISAKGVEVIAIETASGGDHADAVRRMIDGENGLARDAKVTVQRTHGHQGTYITKEVTARGINQDKTTASIQDFAAYGVVNLEANLYATREEIKAVRLGVPADGKTRVVNLSWGRDIASVATELANQVPRTSPAWTSAVQSIVDRTGEQPSNVKEIRKELALQIAGEMKKELAQTSTAQKISQLKSDLQGEVDQAINKGLVLFNAAGNGRQFGKDLGDESLSTPVTDSINGLITVGAAKLGVTSDARDDVMWQDSAPGADIAAPGADVPVFRQAGMPVNGSGSSFATPYAASVAALMIAANPKITPKQIEQILTSAAVTTNLPGSTDGKGLIDPVKAVEAAKKLAK
jgi:hypothetical protein